MKKKIVKIQKSKILKTKSGDMVDSNLKFGINLRDGFWENAFYGRTDARATAFKLC